MLSTLLIVVGLSFLHLSSFVPSRRFAELAAVTMVAALAGDLALLPASLVLVGKRLLRRHEGGAREGGGLPDPVTT